MKKLDSILGLILELVFGEFGLFAVFTTAIIVWIVCGFSSGLAVLALPTIVVCLTLSFVNYHDKEIRDLKDKYESAADMSRDTIDNL